LPQHSIKTYYASGNTSSKYYAWKDAGAFY